MNVADLKALSAEHPEQWVAFASATGLASLALTTIQAELLRVAPEVEGFGEIEAAAYRMFERREIAKYCFGETADAKWKRGEAALQRASATDLGKMFSKSPLRFNARILSILADNTRKP